MNRAPFYVGLIALVSAGQSLAETGANAASRLPYRIGLIFTDDICMVTEDEVPWHEKHREPFEQGLCSAMESAVSDTFEDYVVLSDASSVANANVDLSLTARWLGLERELIDRKNWRIMMLVEWTLARRDGEIIWMKPIHGSVTGRPKDLDKQVGLILRSLEQNSAAAFRSGPKFR